MNWTNLAKLTTNQEGITFRKKHWTRTTSYGRVSNNMMAYTLSKKGYKALSIMACAPAMNLTEEPSTLT